ncbi:hypothetical protein ACLMJK_002237 [Lecanora helva]
MSAHRQSLLRRNAPLTRDSRSTGTASKVRRHHSSPIRTLSSIGSEPYDWIGPGLHTHRPSPEAEKAAGDQPMGHLGPTSYSAVLRENNLGDSTEDFTHHTTNSILQEYDIAKPSSNERCDLEAQEHVDQGVRILNRFPDKALCRRLIDRYFHVCDVILPEQIVDHVHTSIWSTHHEVLSAPNETRHEKLLMMSRALCKTAMKPLSPSSNNKEWIESFSGKNLRWEILGNLFALFGLSAMSMSDWDPLFCSTAGDAPSHSKRQYGGAMRECAEACLALCNDVDAVNEFVVSLMAAIYSLQSIYEGDIGMFDFLRYIRLK